MVQSSVETRIEVTHQTYTPGDFTQGVHSFTQVATGCIRHDSGKANSADTRPARGVQIRIEDLMNQLKPHTDDLASAAAEML